jgi:hypothetical protein
MTVARVFASALVGSSLWVGGVAAAGPAASSGPHPPTAGHWRIHSIDGTATGGSFLVTKGHRYVRRLKVTTDAAGCGNQTVKVIGKHRVHQIKGKDGDGQPFDAWIVGRKRSKDEPPEKPTKVTVSQTGDPPIRGLLMLVFHGRHGGRKAFGTLGWNDPASGNSCFMDFSFSTS